MNILITGASGFLGKYLVKQLLKNNHKITAVSRDKEKLSSLFPSTVALAQTDYSIESLTQLTKEQDVVIHLASLLMQKDTDPLKISSFFENITMLENILLACHHNKVNKVIQTSSISTYNNKQVNLESFHTHPSNIYGVSKACCDIYAEYFSDQTSLEIINLKLARLYGVGERDGLMMTNFISQAFAKQTLNVHGHGNSSVEYIYIKDAVDAIEKSIELNESSTINIGSGKAYTVKEIVETINKVFNNDKNVKYMPEKTEIGPGSVMDIGKAKHILNWQPKWTLEQALEDIKSIMEKG